MDQKKILIVDDDQEIQELLKRGLESLGYKVEIANDEKTFNEIFLNIRPDAILLDVSLPGLDGISLCKEIKQRPGASDIPILIVTAFDDKKTYNDAFLHGADEFLVKPLQIDNVRDKIEQVIIRKRNLYKNKAIQEKGGN